MDRRRPPDLSGRIPLAVVLVDAAGLVSHWSTGARGLFGWSGEEAVGRAATDLLPVGGVAFAAGAGGAAYPPLEALSPGLEPQPGRGVAPSAGMARLFDRAADGGPGEGGPAGSGSWDDADRERTAVEVLWWAYPLAGPGPERLLVLAADASLPEPAGFGAEWADGSGEAAGTAGAAGTAISTAAGAMASDGFPRITPGFALYTEIPGADQIALRLPGILPGLNPPDSARIVAQVLALGSPVLEVSRGDRLLLEAGRRDRLDRWPAAPGRGMPRRADESWFDPEYAVVREHPGSATGPMIGPATGPLAGPPAGPLTGPAVTPPCDRPHPWTTPAAP